MDVVVRFTHSGGNTDFYRDEIMRLDYQVKQPIDLFWSAYGHAHIYYVAKEYVIIRITFDLTRSSTIDRIETLYDLIDATYYQPEVMTCYYRYGIDTTTYSKEVQMLRDEMIFPYAAGRKESTQITISFCEAVDFPTISAGVAQQIDLGVA